MTNLNTFTSIDGLKFTDKIDCATHEINNCQSIKEALEEALKYKDLQSIYNWCTNEVCCCVGCINYNFISNGLTQYHWKAYVRQKPNTFIDEFTTFNLKLEGFKDKEKTILKIKSITGLGNNEAKDLLKKDSLLKIGIPLVEAENHQKQMNSVGAITKIIPY